MTTPSKFDLPQGTLDLLILRVVALGPVHGYAIAQHIQMISKEALQIQQGSLYPALHRLENKNFLVAEWGPTETGREAKFYRLTAKGRTQLKTETESWERLTEVVAMILQHPLGEPHELVSAASKTGRMEKELDAELRFHFESQVADRFKRAKPKPKRAARPALNSVVSSRSSKTAAKAAELSGSCPLFRTCALARASWPRRRDSR
jgi:PadR family transcriptional regulator PadR